MSARTRGVGSVVLLVLVCVLAFVSVIAVWMRALVLDTDSYVRAVGPLIEKPALRDELALQIVDALYTHVDVEQLLQESLPKDARILAPTLAQGIHDTAIQLAASALSTNAVRRVWEATNRVAHEQVVHVLEGKGTVVKTARGEVSLDLRPIAEQVRRTLDEHGVDLFDQVPAAALDQQFVLFRSADLARAQQATKLLDELGTWLPVATVVAIGGAIALADHRRRATGRVFLALAGTMVGLSVAVAVGRSSYLDHVGTEISRAAAAVPFDGLVRSLRTWTRIIFVASVLGSRQLVAREREVRLALGGVARAHGRVLAGSGVAFAALALVGWDRPSPRTVAGVVLALVVWLVAVRLLALERLPAPGRAGD